MPYSTRCSAVLACRAAGLTAGLSCPATAAAACSLAASAFTHCTAVVECPATRCDQAALPAEAHHSAATMYGCIPAASCRPQGSPGVSTCPSHLLIKVGPQRRILGPHHVPEARGAQDQVLVGGGQPVLGDLRPAADGTSLACRGRGGSVPLPPGCVQLCTGCHSAGRASGLCYATPPCPNLPPPHLCQPAWPCQSPGPG